MSVGSSFLQELKTWSHTTRERLFSVFPRARGHCFTLILGSFFIYSREVTHCPCQQHLQWHSYPLKSEGSGQGYRLLAAETAFCSQGGDSKEHGTLSADRLAQSDKRLLSWLWKTVGDEERMQRAPEHVLCLRTRQNILGAGSSEKHWCHILWQTTPSDTKEEKWLLNL